MEPFLKQVEQALGDRYRVEREPQNATPVPVASLFLPGGDRDRAFQWLERAYQARDPNFAYIGVAPVWDPVRDDPRFRDLLKRMRLPN